MFREQNAESEESIFERKKHDFFLALGLRARDWLKTHKHLGGLWQGEKSQRWENVTKHCLVEAARVEEFSDLLNLSPKAKNELFAAAIIHDYNKKEEIEHTGAQNRTPESFEEVYAITSNKLKEFGVDETVIALADSVGHSPVPEIEKILEQGELDEFDVQKLVMHYVDDYTLGDEWVTPTEQSNGVLINDFDRRMTYNEANQKYIKIKEQGYYQEMRRVGYLVESKLTSLIKESSGIDIDAKSLPEFIDKKIRAKITERSL